MLYTYLTYVVFFLVQTMVLGSDNHGIVQSHSLEMNNKKGNGDSVDQYHISNMVSGLHFVGDTMV